jgi:diguanylate cyclase
LRYTETKEQSAELLRKVLTLLGQHDAPFHPVSFAVWYEFAAGTNMRLTQGIERAMQTEPRLTDATVVRLYQEFVAEVDQEAMQRITGELQRMMTGMSESASRTGEHAGAFGEQLSGLTEVLQANDAPAIASHVAATLASTVQMQSSAQELQAQVLAHRQEIQRLQSDLVRARDEATLDPLTQVLNRKGFDRMLASLLDQPPSPDSAHCLVMLDIDHFKKVNDTHGHVMGDRVIQALGEVLRLSVSDKNYSVARYGGEEFAILLPHCTIEQSMKVADTVRQRTKAMKIRDRRTQQVVLTVSISGGVAAMQAGDDAQDLIARADAALYKSKQAGRDQVTCAA